MGGSGPNGELQSEKQRGKLFVRSQPDFKGPKKTQMHQFNKNELDSTMISRLDHFHQPLPTKYWASQHDNKTFVKNHTDQSKISLDF